MTDYDDNLTEEEIITLELAKELENSKIVEDFIFEIGQKNFILDLNHEYKDVRVIWHYNKNWTLMKSNLNKECKKKGVKEEHIPYIENTIDLNYNSITATQENYYNNNQQQQKDQQQDKEDKEENEDNDKMICIINKYSQGIPLAESVLANNISYFIQIIDDGKPIYKQKIELSDINIVPPERTEYLSKEYSFESLEEVEYFINLAKQETLDSLFNNRVKPILKKYIDIDEDFINILTADIIFTYFQDRLKMTHYLLIVGDNNTGKSNILLVFSYLGYRSILDTAITPANIYNYGSQLEEGQCIIIEDEIDDIDDQDEKKKLYKVSYRGGTKVTRMYESNNNNHSNSRKSSSRQQGFFLFNFKMFASEKMPDKIKSKGFLERIIPLKAVVGDPQFDISEVVDESGDEKFKELYQELMNTRKLLLMYRLLHHNETIPDIKLNIKNRYKQLTKPVIRLFQNTETAIEEITKSLSKYLIEKNQEKIDSMDSALLIFIINLVSTNGETLYNDEIWNELKNEYPNGEIPDKKYSWYMEGYGSISKNNITKICETKFGAKLYRDREKGRGLIFNQNTLNKLVSNYSIIEGIQIIRDTRDICDSFTGYTKENSKDSITKNGKNVTFMTHNEEGLIPQNDNLITKNYIDIDTKPNGYSPEVSHLSHVSQSTTSSATRSTATTKEIEQEKEKEEKIRKFLETDHLKKVEEREEEKEKKEKEL